MSKTLIKNAFVVSVDPKVGNIDGADILVVDGRIAQIGKNLGVESGELVDATGCIAIPGFVDTHRHLWEGSIRSVTADYSILDFIGNVRLFASRFLRPQDMYATGLQGGLEVLNAGVTTIADYCHNVRSPDHATESIRGVREAGVRTVWSFSFTGLGKGQSTFESTDDRVRYLRALAASEFASRDSLLTLGLCPEEPSWWGSDLPGVRRQFDLARELHAPMFMHANNRPTFDGAMPRDVAKLKDLGVLGPDIILVHMCCTAADEWEMLGAAGGHVSYTPETEYQMGLGFPNVSAPAAAGVNVSVGVDITANNSADMFTQLRMLLQVERARVMTETLGSNNTRTAFDCADALYWGTMGGAKALGLDDLVGSLTPGKAADIVLLRADDITMVGWDRRNPAATVIQQAGTHSVETVMVAGRLVKRDGKLLGDAARACRLLQETSEQVHARAREEGGFDASEDELYRRLGRTKATAEQQRRNRLNTPATGSA